MNLINTLQDFNNFKGLSLYNHDFFNSTPINSSNSVPVNIIEGEDAYRIEIEAPGFTKDDLNISLNKNKMTVRASKEESNEESTEKFLRKEFTRRSILKSFSLPKNTDLDNITAKFENGVLFLHISKIKEIEEKIERTIKIQ